MNNVGQVSFDPPIQYGLSPLSSLSFLYIDSAQTQDQKSLYRIMLPTGLVFGQSATSISQTW